MKKQIVVKLTRDEAEAVTGCLARGGSVLNWRRELEMQADDKIRAALSPQPPSK